MNLLLEKQDIEHGMASYLVHSHYGNIFHGEQLSFRQWHVKNGFMLTKQALVTTSHKLQQNISAFIKYIQNKGKMAVAMRILL